MMISPQQIRAARAWLNWSRDEAEVELKVSSSTIRNMEKDDAPALANRAADDIRNEFEKRGFQFHGLNGLSCLESGTRSYQGDYGSDYFYEELLNKAKSSNDKIYAYFRSQKLFFQALGVSVGKNVHRLRELAQITKIQCLTCEVEKILPDIANLDFRITAYHPLSTISQMVYDNSTAGILIKGRMLVYHITDSVEIATEARKDFETHWDKAVPLLKSPIA